jgi:hypothetical protein
MAKQENRGYDSSRQADAFELLITPSMIAAGLDELRLFTLGSDLGEAAEAIYRAMAVASYAERASASTKSDSK